MKHFRSLTALFAVLLLCPQLKSQNLDFVGFLGYDQRVSDIWGWEDTVNDLEYALVGVLDGLSIVDISDPASPFEVAFLDGAESIWRDIKTWDGYAYVTNETSGGLLIANLNQLPAFPDTVNYQGRELESAHNIFIDEQGVAYVVGANIDNGGATMLDLTVDPMAPVFLGAYVDFYVHDAYARNDTLWTAEVSNGQFSIIDISDKSNPVTLGSQSSPIGLTHNIWLSDDGKTVGVTEEFPAGHVLTYDVSDPTDIQELARYRTNWEEPVIPHNTFYQGDWLVTSSYVDGVTIVDAARPTNLVETGRFDTSPVGPIAAFNGCWGVYPYSSNNLVLASDIELGLYVLRPEYKRAAYLEGTVRDQVDGSPLLFARVELLSTSTPPYITDFTGEFFTGTVDSGTYTIRVSRSGCETRLYTDLDLIPGQVTTIDPMLSCTSTAVQPIDEDQVLFQLQPSVFSSSSTLQWDLGDKWQPDAQIQWIAANGRVIPGPRLDGPSGSLNIADNLSSGYWILQLQSGSYRKMLRAVKR